MSRYKNFLNELSSIYGKGITFIDIDETIFKTFAKIYVLDKETKEIKQKLTNQEFNTYKLKDNEEFDFCEFRDAKTFNETSIPIEKTIKRIKRMFKNIDKRESKVVLLTARADFNDKETFLETFRKHGIPIDSIYVERVGNFKSNPAIYKNIIRAHGMPKSIADAKEKVIINYINTGEYRRVRLIDDDIKNIKTFLKIKDKLSDSIIQKIKTLHKISERESIEPIEFYGLLVQENGKLKQIKGKE